MRQIHFATNHFYHIFNRGIEKRQIFPEEKDFLRFYTSLFAFNDSNFRAIEGLDVQTILRTHSEAVGSDPLVSIMSFCLLPNHFHLLVEQLTDDGISRFMHRLTSGYAHYFNKKYDRTGRLFEGPFKAVMVERDAQLEHLPRYIHLNALDHTDLKWREGKIENWEKAKKFLDQYRWSSHHVFQGKPQLLPIVQESVAKKMFETPSKYMEFLKQWSGREMDP